MSSEQFVITAGDYVSHPVGPFASEAEAHAYYQSNRPRASEGDLPYITAPTIVRLLRPCPAHVLAGADRG